MEKLNSREQLENLVRQVDSEFKNDLAKVDDVLCKSTDSILFMQEERSATGVILEKWSIDEDAIGKFPEAVQNRFRQLFNDLIARYNADS